MKNKLELCCAKLRSAFMYPHSSFLNYCCAMFIVYKAPLKLKTYSGQKSNTIGTSGQRFSWSPFRLRRLTGMTIVDCYFHNSFPPLSHRRSARIKNLFSESSQERPKTFGYTFFQTRLTILGPPGGHFGFLWFSQKVESKNLFS